MEVRKRIIKKAHVEERRCVACGACELICPRSAIAVWKGCFAKVNESLCVGCGLCARTCPAGVIAIETRDAQ